MSSSQPLGLLGSTRKTSESMQTNHCELNCATSQHQQTAKSDQAKTRWFRGLRQSRRVRKTVLPDQEVVAIDLAITGRIAAEADGRAVRGGKIVLPDQEIVTVDIPVPVKVALGRQQRMAGNEVVDQVCNGVPARHR